MHRVSRAFSSNARRPLRGIIFDMDGTLTKPNLDFKEMYQKCGVPLSDDLLVSIAKMPQEQAAAARAVLAEMEAEGRRTLELFPGAAECCRWLQQHGIRMALVTRNTAETVTHLHAAHWEPAGLQPFEPAISRDTANIPAKPDPAALHAIAAQWDVSRMDELVMVGDSLPNDVGFGKAAGTATALVDSGRRHVDAAKGDGAGDPDFCVENLALLPQLLWKHFDIESGSSVTPGAQKFDKPTAETAAASAAANGDVDALRALPTEQLDAVDATGNTPLIWAAQTGHANCVEHLLSRGAAVNSVGFLGATAVSRASRFGHMDSLALLLAAPGVDCDLANLKLQSPLHFAAFKHKPAAVEMLLAHGANTLVLDRKGRTPAEDTSDAAIRESILAVRAKQMATPSLWQP